MLVKRAVLFIVFSFFALPAPSIQSDESKCRKSTKQVASTPADLARKIRDRLRTSLDAYKVALDSLFNEKLDEFENSRVGQKFQNKPIPRFRPETAAALRKHYEQTRDDLSVQKAAREALEADPYITWLKSNLMPAPAIRTGSIVFSKNGELMAQTLPNDPVDRLLFHPGTSSERMALLRLAHDQDPSLNEKMREEASEVMLFEETRRALAQLDYSLSSIYETSPVWAELQRTENKEDVLGALGDYSKRIRTTLGPKFPETSVKKLIEMVLGKVPGLRLLERIHADALRRNYDIEARSQPPVYTASELQGLLTTLGLPENTPVEILLEARNSLSHIAEKDELTNYIEFLIRTFRSETAVGTELDNTIYYDLRRILETEKALAEGPEGVGKLLPNYNLRLPLELLRLPTDRDPK